MYKDGTTIGGLNFQVVGDHFIKHNSAVNHLCDIFLLPPDAPVIYAKVRIIGTYGIPLGYVWKRRFTSGPFYWKKGVAGNQWMDAEPVN
jgi:hypothetical protein